MDFTQNYEVPDIPPQAYLYFPLDEEITIMINKSFQRIFFDGQIKLNADEKTALVNFQNFIKQNNFSLPNWFTENILIRFLYANNFKFPEVHKSIIMHAEWRNSQLTPKMTNNMFDNFLNNGVIYVHGRDNRFRPIIILRGYLLDINKLEINEILSSVTYLLAFVIENLMLPGQIENWNFIIDFNHMRVTDLPLSIIKTILRTLQTNFIGRLHRMYLINVTKTISFFWNIIKTFLEETTTYKISLFNNNLLENFYSYTNKCQTENCLGGDCPDLDENFWPPKFPSDKYLLDQDDVKQILVSEEEYKGKFEMGFLKKNKICKELISKKKKETQLIDESIIFEDSKANSITLNIFKTKTKDNLEKK